MDSIYHHPGEGRGGEGGGSILLIGGQGCSSGLKLAIQYFFMDLLG